MSKPIKETPILTGRDAVNFYEQKAVDEKFKKKRPAYTAPALSPTTPLPEAQPLEGVKTAEHAAVVFINDNKENNLKPFDYFIAGFDYAKSATDAVNQLGQKEFDELDRIDKAIATDAGGGKDFVQRVYDICSKRAMPTEGEIQSLEIEAFNILEKAPSTHSSSEMVERSGVVAIINKLIDLEINVSPKLITDERTSMYAASTLNSALKLIQAL